MGNSSKLSTQSIFLIFFTLIFLFFSVSDLEAARKKKRKYRAKNRRSYNPKQTRAQAIDLIRNSSEELSELAGIEPVVSDDKSKLDELIAQEEGEILHTEDGDMGENLEELNAEDDVMVDLDEFKMLWLSFINNDGDEDLTMSGISKSEMMLVIMDWLGTPYRFGGTSRSNIDCSAFTQRVFLSSAEVMLPRVAREQVKYGTKITKKNLQFGDLVFFHTYSRRFASHVGIYLGDNLFAHASSRYGVTVSSLESSYYSKNFIGGRRLSSRDIAKLSVDQGTQLNASGEVLKSKSEKGK